MSLTDIIHKHDNLIVFETLLGLSKLADVSSTLLCTNVAGVTVEYFDISRSLMEAFGNSGFVAAELGLITALAYGLRNSSRGIIYGLTALQSGMAMNNLYAYYFC